MSIVSPLTFATQNEQLVALTLEALNHHYPNVLFTGVDTGTGVYGIMCRSKYRDRTIADRTLQEFNNYAYTASDIIAVAVKRLETDGLIEHYE